MNLFAFSGFLLGVTCLLLSILIIKYKANNIHLTFGLQNFAISIWGFGCGFAGMSKIPTEAHFWWSVAHIGAFFVAVFLLHHALLLNHFSQRKLLIALYT